MVGGVAAGARPPALQAGAKSARRLSSSPGSLQVGAISRLGSSSSTSCTGPLPQCGHSGMPSSRAGRRSANVCSQSVQRSLAKGDGRRRSKVLAYLVHVGLLDSTQSRSNDYLYDPQERRTTSYKRARPRAIRTSRSRPSDRRRPAGRPPPRSGGPIRRRLQGALQRAPQTQTHAHMRACPMH
jgi:hypothetical protein